MQANLSSKIGFLSFFLGICFFSLNAHAFQNIDRDTYFPGIAQGHGSYYGNCQYAQLELNNSAKINETQGAALNYCSSNKGAGLPSDSCDNGHGGYQSCEITGYNTPSLALGYFQTQSSSKYRECHSGSKEFTNRKYNQVELRNSCRASFKNSSGTTYLNSLALEDDATLTLSSGDYWIVQISTSDDAHIKISGDVRLFVYYDFLLNNDTKITLEQGASLTVVGFNDVQLNNDSSLEGDVYANGLLSLNND
ncbi:MSHA biogenesis protein MshQ, partial [Aliivibrio sifiae]